MQEWTECVLFTYFLTRTGVPREPHICCCTDFYSWTLLLLLPSFLYHLNFVKTYHLRTDSRDVKFVKYNFHLQYWHMFVIVDLKTLFHVLYASMYMTAFTWLPLCYFPFYKNIVLTTVACYFNTVYHTKFRDTKASTWCHSCLEIFAHPLHCYYGLCKIKKYGIRMSFNDVMMILSFKKIDQLF